MSRSDLLVTGWCKNVESVPTNYIMPPEKRPSHFSVSKEIPVLDLKQGTDHHGRSDLITQMIKSCEDYGLFQVINHGISEDMMHETMNLYKEFFSLPSEEYENNNLLSEDYYKSVRLYTSGFNYDNEEFHLWKDTLKHMTHPLEDVIHEWPKKPDTYREVLAKYSSEVRKMSLRILDLICEGLGLEEGFFRKELSEATGMVINNYPPCPEPSLAMGIHAHCDPYVLTIIHQELYGLQIKKDEEWLGVEPLPNAFIIMVPYQLQVISNGKLKSCIHRGVTNSNTSRISIVTFIGPDKDCVIRPAKEHVTASNPRRYKSFKYLDFQINYLYQLSVKNLCDETALGPYLINANDG